MAKGKSAPLCAEWLSEPLGAADDDELAAFEDWMRWGGSDCGKCLKAVERGWSFFRDDEGKVRRIH